jgi:hypothetical protein
MRVRGSSPSEELWGVMLLGEAKREAPAQAELLPAPGDDEEYNEEMGDAQ